MDKLKFGSKQFLLVIGIFNKYALGYLTINYSQEQRLFMMYYLADI